MMVCKGDKVEATGVGRTAFWPRTVGTITGVTKRSVFVRWDHSIVEDELAHDEVRVIPVEQERARPGQQDQDEPADLRLSGGGPT